MNREELKRLRESGRELLSADIAPSTVNDADRTLDVIWFTGRDVDRYDWWTDTAYVLRFDPDGCDMALLNGGSPVCNSHESDTLTGQIGVVLKAWKANGQYLASLKLKRSSELTGPRAELDGIWQDIKDGVTNKISMGVEMKKTEDKRDKNGKLEMRIAKEWQPFELSFVPVAADMGTATLSPESKLLIPPSILRAQRECEILRLR